MIYIDNSTLSSFAKCPSQAVLRYHLGYTSPDESTALKCGTAVHAALEQFFRGGSREGALFVLEQEYMDWSIDNVPEGTRLSYTNVYNVLDVWLERHPLESLPYKVDPEFVEIGFNQPLNEDICLVGRLDAAVSSWDGQWWYALDHKTTASISPQWVRMFQLGSQMSGYVWALSEMMPNVVGAYINGIEMKKLPSDAKRKCSTHGVKYAECGRQHATSELFITQRTQEELDEWKKCAIGLAYGWSDLTAKIRDPQDLHEARMEGMFTGACSWCEFYDHCITGRKPEQVERLYVLNPWTPHEQVAAAE